MDRLNGFFEFQLSTASDSARIKSIRLILGLGFLAGILFSSGLWHSHRDLPLVPLIDGFSIRLLSVRDLCFPFLIFFALMVAFTRHPFSFLLGFLGCAALAIFEDVNRLQSWVYQYLLFSAVLVAHYSRRETASRLRSTLNICRLIIPFVYIWAGFHKLNINYCEQVMPWLVSIFVKSPSHSTIVLMGVFTAVYEIVMGCALLSQRLRSKGIAMAFVMHATLLFLLGPLAYNWNSTVWPWNIAMPMFGFVLFRDTTNLPIFDVLRPKALLHSIFFGLAVILPCLGQFGLWPTFLSFSLYSANYTSGELLISYQDTLQLTPSLRARIKDGYLNINYWSIEETNAGSFPEPLYFKGVMKSLCRSMGPDATSTLLIKTWPHRFSREPNERRYTCRDLT